MYFTCVILTIGAGKSTLMTALMRLVELDGGNILLDGIDIKSVGLTKLRSNIAVIPQVRTNSIICCYGKSFIVKGLREILFVN